MPFSITSEEMDNVVIKYIFETTGILLDDIGQIVTNPTFKGMPFLLILDEHDSQWKVTLAKKTIPGSLILRPDYHNVGIDSLGVIEIIDGDFGICDAPIENLGNLNKITGDFWIARYDDYLKIHSLKPLKEVGGNVVINDINLSTLGTLERVNGNLNLRKSNISDLGSLKCIGGNFLGKKEIFCDYDFSKIDVKGKIKFYNS